MTLDDISMLAFRNEMPDIGALTVPEWLYWYRMRDVYRQYADNRDEGAKQKKVVLRQYELDRSAWVQAAEVHDYLAKFWKDAEGPSRAYAKSQNRTPEGDAMFEAFYKVPLKVQKEKWEESSP